MGRAAMYCNYSGQFNVAIGRSALYENYSACYGVAVGFRALACNNSGGYEGRDNTAVGAEALYLNIEGSCNVAVGRSALCSNTSGQNVAVGWQALLFNSTGAKNVAIGANAAPNQTSPGSNTAVGFNTLNQNIYGANLTALGAEAGTVFTYNYQIAVGANANTSNVAGHTVWGSSANNVYNCVWAAWTTVSDARDKANIEPLSRNMGLSLINRLNPVSFNWDQRQRYVDKCGFEYGEKDGTLITAHREYGLIAQELKQALDELGEQFDALKYNSTQDSYRLTYEGLIAPIIKSIQELSARVESIEKKL